MSASVSSSSLRADNRSNSQLRSITAEYSLLNRADGSVRYLQGSTELLVAVYGPIACTQREEKYNKSIVTVQFKSPTQNNKTNLSNNFDLSGANIIQNTIESILLSSLHPRTKISITIQVIINAGSVLAAAINASCLALLDAGVQLNSMISAIQIQLVPKSNITTDDNNAMTDEKTQSMSSLTPTDFQLDPTDSEEEKCPNSILLAFNSIDSGVVTSICGGIMSETIYFQALETGRRACAHIQHFYRQSLTKKIITKETE